MNENIKVYRITECSWIATPWNLDKTVEWFENEYGEIDQEDIDNIKECSLGGTFWEEVKFDTALTEHIPDTEWKVGAVTLRCGDKIKLTTFGKYVSGFKEEIKKPFEIASTEY